jgi:hypothetical protein
MMGVEMWQARWHAPAKTAEKLRFAQENERATTS